MPLAEQGRDTAAPAGSGASSPPAGSNAYGSRASVADFEMIDLEAGGDVSSYPLAHDESTAVRLDGPSDGSLVLLSWSAWRPDGVVVEVPVATEGGLRTGDRVVAVEGHRLADGLGDGPRPAPGATVRYEVIRGVATPVSVPVGRDGPIPLLREGWGNLVFVVALAALALALYVRRPEEPATAPLLVLAAGLLGSTLMFLAIPEPWPVSLATRGRLHHPAHA